MAEYIERDHVLQLLGVFNDRVHGDYHFMNGIETAKEIVENAPSVDVALVEHSKWKFDPLGGDWECLVCGYHSMEHGNYCTHCGARMDSNIEPQVQPIEKSCPPDVLCPMDGFQTGCPNLWTEKCPYWNPSEHSV